MKRIKRRTFSGSVCEQIVYNVRESTDTKTARPPKPRFENEEDRAKHREEISRRKNAQLINNNFGPTSHYCTLTLSVEYEVHTAAECRRVRDNLYRRILYRYPSAKVYIVYGQGKSTGRFHLHMLIDGVPADEIGKIWGRGSVIDIKPLREHNYYKDKDGKLVDHGQDYTGLANYLFNHWRPEFGGHRWKASRNCKQPEPEAPTQAVREYSPEHPPVAPRGYVIVEARATQYGYQYYKYVRQPDKIKRNGRRLN